MIKKEKLKSIKNFILDLFFPKFCLGCSKEGTYLCQDCRSILDILEFQYCLCEKNPQRVINTGKCPKCKTKKLDGLYFAVSYHHPLVKDLILKFKYRPFAKELAKNLAQILEDHFLISGKNPKDFEDFLIVAIPLHKERENWRGFNQAEELAKELSLFFRIPLLKDVLIKIKKVPPQVELNKKEREENVKNAFELKNPQKILGRKIFLVDDIYTTGATMEECANVLKKGGAKEVWGIAIAREMIT